MFSFIHLDSEQVLVSMFIFLSALPQFFFLCTWLQFIIIAVITSLWSDKLCMCLSMIRRLEECDCIDFQSL